MVSVERPKTKEKFASREKIRKWKLQKIRANKFASGKQALKPVFHFNRTET
jgi:hypothetical protein